MPISIATSEATSAHDTGLLTAEQSAREVQTAATKMNKSKQRGLTNRKDSEDGLFWLEARAFELFAEAGDNMASDGIGDVGGVER